MEKIAVLGGGLGSMSAVYALTSAPDWKQRYEITVYQMGWRLGGKGASGRNARYGQRIEEHGLHIWMGFYENAFEGMRHCYEEMNRPPGAPLRTWEEAFRPHSAIQLSEFVDGQWVDWPLEMPVNSGVPGSGRALPSAWDYVEMMLQAMLEAILGQRFESALIHWIEEWRSKRAPLLLRPLMAVLEWIGKLLGKIFGRVVRGVEKEALHWLAEHLHAAHQRAAGMSRDPEQHDPADRAKVLGHVEGFLERLEQALAKFVREHHATRRLWILLNLGAACIRGIIQDDLLTRGFAAADGEEFRAWLRRHGADELTVSSAPVREIYDLCFAYHDGDLERPDLAAGTALEIALRIAFTYQGACMYKMQAGMGDTVFTPFYEVLKARGVKFEFFHRVSRIGLDEAGRSVDSIEVEKQVDLVDEAAGYRPLVDVKGLPCWPSEPFYRQIVQGEELRRRGINLESRWSGWEPVSRTTLRGGRDFDRVVLGISLAALPELCAELIDKSAAWRRMVDSVKTVRTQAVQLWLDPTMPELGRPAEGLVGGTYAEPFDTWADMSELLATEDWGDGGPKTITYHCGPLRGGAGPPPSDTEFPGREDAALRERALTWFRSNGGGIFPRGGSPANPAGLDWSKLHAGGDVREEQRFDQQCRRANIDPSERYVLSVAGSTEHRLHPGDSGFENLVLAGDWVRTPLSAGCVEAAVMGGLAAGRAICGWPEKIVGWPDPDPS